MNQPHARQRMISLVAILAGLLLCLFISAVLFVLATASVTGSATLPNGSRVGITTKWGFGVSANENKTRIEAGRYVVEIDENLTVNVNGTEVGVLEQQPKSYSLVVNADGLEMSCADGVVARLK